MLVKCRPWTADREVKRRPQNASLRVAALEVCEHGVDCFWRQLLTLDLWRLLIFFDDSSQLRASDREETNTGLYERLLFKRQTLMYNHQWLINWCLTPSVVIQRTQEGKSRRNNWQPEATLGVCSKQLFCRSLRRMCEQS